MKRSFSLRTMSAALSLVGVLAFSGTTLAEPLRDERGEVRQELTVRCPDDKKIAQEHCALSREEALQEGCLEPEDMQFAADKNLVIICEPGGSKFIFLACPCS